MRLLYFGAAKGHSMPYRYKTPCDAALAPFLHTLFAT